MLDVLMASGIPCASGNLCSFFSPHLVIGLALRPRSLHLLAERRLVGHGHRFAVRGPFALITRFPVTEDASRVAVQVKGIPTIAGVAPVTLDRESVDLTIRDNVALMQSGYDRAHGVGKLRDHVGMGKLLLMIVFG